MESKSILSDMIIEKYVRDTNRFIKFQNRVNNDTQPEITEADVVEALKNTNKQEEILQANKQCWKLYFESVEDLIFPYLDKLSGVRVDE